jgi:asparagine synthase (glutamine-hydrolysing)
LADATMRLEVTRYLRNQLLRDADVMGMACGVEIRVPFVDAGVVDTMLRIDHPARFRPRKALLTDAVPELPRWVVDQPKRGFMFPVDEWMRGEWHDVFADNAQRGGMVSGPWYRHWCVRAFVEFAERGRRAATAAARPPAADRVLIS